MKKLLSLLIAAVGLVPALAQAQDAKAGEKKAAMCIGCHGIPGYQASFPEVHKVPMISGQGAKYIVPAGEAPAHVAELLKKGNCSACHGENLNKPIDPSYPKLAGQHADYLYVALKAYQVDGNPQVGRNNAIMAGLAKPFTHAELKLLASHIATLPGELKVVSQPRFR